MRASVDVTLPLDYNYPITYNDPELTAKMLPTLERSGNVQLVNATTGAEDFSFFQEEVPGLYMFVGGKPLNVDKKDAPAHHTPEFYVDDAGMPTGIKLLTNLTLDYMKANK
jgi:amidohydrolase